MCMKELEDDWLDITDQWHNILYQLAQAQCSTFSSIDCVQTKGLALYSTHLVNGSDYTGHSDESLARENIFSQPVTGCKSKVRIYMASNTVGEICCWSYSYAQTSFRWFINIYLFLTCLDSSPVQSTSVQWHPWQSSIVALYKNHHEL